MWTAPVLSVLVRQVWMLFIDSIDFHASKFCHWEEKHIGKGHLKWWSRESPLIRCVGIFYMHCHQFIVQQLEQFYLECCPGKSIDHKPCWVRIWIEDCLQESIYDLHKLSLIKLKLISTHSGKLEWTLFLYPVPFCIMTNIKHIM